MSASCLEVGRHVGIQSRLMGLFRKFEEIWALIESKWRKTAARDFRGRLAKIADISTHRRPATPSLRALI